VSSEPQWQRHLRGGQVWKPVEPGESLARVWADAWRERPEAVALVDLTGEQEVVHTRADVEARSAQAAGRLAAVGIGAGDRVVFSGAPSADYVFLYLGALRLGAVIVPANTAYTAAELGHIVSDSGAGHLVLDDAARAPEPSLTVIVPGTGAGDVAPPAGLDAAVAGDLAMIAYTSGTTGRPKGAMLSHGNLLASARAVGLAWRWTEDDGLVLALPLFHIHGLGVGLHGSLVAGARILLLRGFTPPAVAAAAARPDSTLFFGVPTMHTRLVEHAQADPDARDALASLRLLVSGSAPLSDELWQRVADVTGQRIIERYGMTETVMNISNPYDGDRRPGTVGIPLPGVEVRLDAEGDGPGEVLVRGQNVFAGYWNRPEATQETFAADGWLRTGDVGVRSPDGYFAIVGRSKELIISGGYNIYPREVEEALEAHPAIREAAVVGRPSDEWGESVAAFVAPADGATVPDAGELSAFVGERLAGYKKPREYHVIDVVPRNALGKIDRRRVGELLERGGEST
jgi:malonyl-CoA/methylmalonyl-CoA synthetase